MALWSVLPPNRAHAAIQGCVTFDFDLGSRLSGDPGRSSGDRRSCTEHSTTRSTHISTTDNIGDALLWCLPRAPHPRQCALPAKHGVFWALCEALAAILRPGWAVLRGRGGAPVLTMRISTVCESAQWRRPSNALHGGL